jgi:hypothetical protein
VSNEKSPQIEKLLFSASLPFEQRKAVLKACRKISGKTLEKAWLFQPKKLLPVDYLTLKILHQQFRKGKRSVLPLGIGITRKALYQVKRMVSHGSF